MTTRPAAWRRVTAILCLSMPDLSSLLASASTASYMKMLALTHQVSLSETPQFFQSAARSRHRLVAGKVFRSVLAVWAAIASVLGVGAQVYSVKDLGLYSDLPSHEPPSRPNAINTSGRVAAANTITGAYRAWLYGGAWTNLGTLGGDESLALGINDSNRVVGYSANASGIKRGFLWTPGGTDGVAGNPQMKELGTLGGIESEASDISGIGQICGHAQVSGGDFHAFRYSSGTLTDIHSLPSTLPHSFATGINDSGRISGIGYKSNFGNWEAFFYNGTNMVRLGTFGGANSSAMAINNSDQIAGFYTTSSGYDRAFRYVSGAMTELGTLGGHWSYANGINNSNVIVGGSYVDLTDTNFHAFVWATNVMTDLNTRLDATGAGWTLLEARAINDAGQIVGLGRFNSGNHFFLLTPVTPPLITGQPTNQTINCPGSVTFTVSANPPEVFYRWYKGAPPSGAPISDATNSTLTLLNLTGADSGGYFVVITNGAGSVTSDVAILTVVDSMPPVISGCPGNFTNNTTFNLCSAVVSWAAPTANDNCEGSVGVTCSPPSGSVFSKGITIVTCVASDSSQNTNSCSFTVTVQDRQRPVMTGCLGPMTNSTAPGACNAVVSWTNPTANDNCDGAVPVLCNPPSGSTFPKGVITVTCRAYDSSQNTNSCSFNVTVQDKQAPVISGCPANLTNTTAPGLCTAVVSWPSPTATDNCNGIVAVTCSPASGSAFPKGITLVACRAVDASQNTNSCYFEVHILDREAPVLGTCPGNITNYVIHPTNSAVVTWIPPAAADNCDGVVPVLCIPASGSTFSAGTTTVICHVSDSSLNTNSCSFAVRVTTLLQPVLFVNRNGSNIVIGFDSTSSPAYTVESSPNLAAGSWTNLVTNIVGTGGVIFLTNRNTPAMSNEFFRVRIATP